MRSVRHVFACQFAIFSAQFTIFFVGFHILIFDLSFNRSKCRNP
jgi:hypothetical protein